MENWSNPNPEPEIKPETDSSHVNPEPEAIARYEPVPELEKAMNAWSWAWELHWISFGVIFTFIALAAFVTGIRTRRRSNFVIWKFRLVVCLLLTVFGSSRSLWLFLYPYELKPNVSGTPTFLLRLLYSLGFPSLSTGFMLVHVAFLDVRKISVTKIQSWSFILSAVTFSYSFVLAANIAMHFSPDSVIAGIACTAFFILLSLVVATSVLYSGVKVIRKNRVNQSTIKRINGGRNFQTTRGCRTGKIAKVTFATAVLALMSSGLYLYMLVNFIQITLFGHDYPKPWPWWSVQTTSRLVEIGMALLMAYTISQKETRTASYRWKFLLRITKLNRQFGIRSSSSDTRKSAGKNTECEDTCKGSVNAAACLDINLQKCEQTSLPVNTAENVVRASQGSNSATSTSTTDV